MTQANAILGLLAQTSIHAGAGSSVGAVDLPIQREGHTGWPCIFGSSMKGALRAKAEKSDRLAKDVREAVFGPETINASDHAGALSVGDARLLLLPVRSLTSTFKWVTCPELLGRFKRDLELVGLKSNALAFTNPEVLDTDSTFNAKVYSGTGDLFLEEYRFTSTAEVIGLKPIIDALVKLMRREDAETELKLRLVVVSNNLFSFLARSATPVTAHIAIESKPKTVKDGALWYEETLPPETLMYLPLMANSSRKKAEHGKSALTASEIKTAATETLFKNGDIADPWLQVGGNETVGMGWFAVQSLESAP